jgi:hypothetical protein
MPVVECGCVPLFADVLSIYSCVILLNLFGRRMSRHTKVLFLSPRNRKLKLKRENGQM